MIYMDIHICINSLNRAKVALKSLKHSLFKDTDTRLNRAKVALKSSIKDCKL